MAGFEEVRPLEGMWAPLQVRLELRQMFERWLSRSRHSSFISGQDEIVDELSLLELCEHYRLEYPGGERDVAKVWNESEHRISDGAPKFDELARQNWVIFDGGRWNMQSVPRGTASYIAYPSPSTRTFLMGLGKARLVARTGTPPHRVQAFVERISVREWLDRRIPIKNPEWLTGRIWERICPKPHPSATKNCGNAMEATALLGEAGDAQTVPDSEVDRAFLEWSAWCDVLGSAGRWDSRWGPTEMRYCREAAHRALDSQRLWGTWNDDASSYADVLEKTFAISQDQLGYSRTPRHASPRTLVSQADWLNGPQVEHLMMERFGTSTVNFAFALLCSELERTDIGPGTTAASAKFLSFAVSHPMALLCLLFRVDALPALLVDMLLYQRTACLAAKLTIERRPELGKHSDRNSSREAQTKEFAVQDALSLLAHHLEEGKLDLEECASLITWCYTSELGNRVAFSDSRRSVGQQLLGMVCKTGPSLA